MFYRFYSSRLCINLLQFKKKVMAPYVWNRSVNFFIYPIQQSYVGGKKIIDYTEVALLAGIADPAILTLHTFFHTLWAQHDLDYAAWTVLKSANPGKTLGVTQLIDQLTSLYIRKWDKKIQDVYDIDTTEYKTLMPKHRIPFQTGTVASRVLAINTLITAIGSDASLATVKASIVAFITLLNTATGKQSGQLKNIDTALVALDASALAAAQGMFFVYASLLAKFYLIPTNIDVYFDIPELHNVLQMVFNATLKIINKERAICRRKMDITKYSVKVTHVGIGIVNIYYTNGIAKKPGVGTIVTALQPNSSATYTFTELGYTDINSFLFLVSITGSKAEVKIEIVLS